MSAMTTDQAAILAALTGGVIPADDIDRGAAEVNAGPVLAAKVESGVNANLYIRGIETAESLAMQRFGCGVTELNPEQIHELLLELKTSLPGFYKQLRADVCVLYLSEPAVWQLIGFPGPSTQAGGYPDFDQPQFLYKK